MNPTLKVDRISKKYTLGGFQSAFKDFRGALVDAALAPLLWDDQNIPDPTGEVHG